MSANIDWENQRAFLAVLEEGSLSAAARRLGVAQPTVRARLEALEQALGTALFIRSVNGMAPTEQARELAIPARAMARASESFVRTASTPPGQVAGTVRIGVSDIVAVEVLPPMLAALRAVHPGVAVEVASSNASADLLEQEVDIAVRMHQPRQAALVCRKVGSIALGFFAHRDYLARRGTPSTVAELIEHDLIGPDRSMGDLQTAQAIAAELTRERFVLRTDSHPVQTALTRAGAGIGVFHRAIGVADPDLVPVLPALPLPSIDTWIVMHEDLRNVPRVRTVFDHLAEAFSAYAAPG